MKIVIYSKVVKEVSGVHAFEINLIRGLQKHYDKDIIYVYDAGHEDKIAEIKQHVKVVKNTGQTIRADICIYSSINHGENNIQAKKYIQVVHTEYSKWNIKPNPEGIDQFISVGDNVQKDLKENFNIDSIVISNYLYSTLTENALSLVTASRIARGKGFERMLTLAEEIKNSMRPFTWLVFGTGSTVYTQKTIDSFKHIPEVIFAGVRKNIQPYVQNADYLVQLSDNEGYSYSVHEALRVNVPVIVTNWVGIEKTIENGMNGYILDMDMQNIDVDQIFENIPNHAKLKQENIIPRWDRLFFKLLNM